VTKEWPHRDRFPKTATYDLDEVLGNEMGPNALWLLEDLCSRLGLEPGMRVLDLGCGRGLTSIFLAREFGVRVWATDLWIPADDNWRRIRAAGLQDSVCPIRAEARSLPFAAEFFDAVVSIDAYQYFGTDDLYLGYLTRLLRPGGKLGVVVPALMQDFDEVPTHLLRRQSGGNVFWDPAECGCFHTADWWRRLWARTGLVEVREAAPVDDGWRLWLDWELVRDGKGFSGFPSDAETLAADEGRYMGFVRLVADKPEDAGAPRTHAVDFRCDAMCDGSSPSGS